MGRLNNIKRWGRRKKMSHKSISNKKEEEFYLQLVNEL